MLTAWLAWWLALAGIWAVLFAWVGVYFPAGTGRYGRAATRWQKRSVFLSLSFGTLILALQLAATFETQTILVREQEAVEQRVRQDIQAQAAKAVQEMKVARERLEATTEALARRWLMEQGYRYQ